MIKINEEVTMSGGDSGLKVKGTEYCTVEVLEPLLPKMKDLGFNYVRGHGKGTPADSNTVNIYCSDVLGGLTRKKTNKKIISISNEIVDATTLDGSLGIYADSTSNAESADDHVNILYSYCGNKYIVGYYDAVKNNLYLSDITHNGVAGDETIEFARVLIAEILSTVENFNEKKSITREFVPFGALSTEKELMIGLDPEFLLTKNNSKIDCSEVVPASSTNPVGTDGEASGYRDIGEFRPTQGAPKELFKTMKGLLAELAVMIRDNGSHNTAKVYCGGGKKLSKAIGGHIHFNIPSSKELVRLLDDFIGKPLLAMKGAERSNGSSYGKLSAIEGKPYGFEYRTPPSFIGRPEVFEGVVAVSYCLAKTWAAISSGKSSFTYMTSSDTGAYLDAYDKLECYEDFKKEIDTLVSFIETGETLEEDDVLAAWEISAEDMASVRV